MENLKQLHLNLLASKSKQTENTAQFWANIDICDGQGLECFSTFF